MPVPDLKDLALKKVKMSRNKLILTFPLVIQGKCCVDGTILNEVSGIVLKSERQKIDFLLVKEQYKIFELARNMLSRSLVNRPLPENFCPRGYILNTLPKIIQNEVEVFMKTVNPKEAIKSKLLRKKKSKTMIACCKSLAIGV